MGNYDHKVHKQIIVRSPLKNTLDVIRSSTSESYNHLITRLLESASGAVVYNTLLQKFTTIDIRTKERERQEREKEKREREREKQNVSTSSESKTTGYTTGLY